MEKKGLDGNQRLPMKDLTRREEMKRDLHADVSCFANAQRKKG